MSGRSRWAGAMAATLLAALAGAGLAALTPSPVSGASYT